MVHNPLNVPEIYNVKKQRLWTLRFAKSGMSVASDSEYYSSSSDQEEKACLMICGGKDTQRNSSRSKSGKGHSPVSRKNSTHNKTRYSDSDSSSLETESESDEPPPRRPSKSKPPPKHINNAKHVDKEASSSSLETESESGEQVQPTQPKLTEKSVTKDTSSSSLETESESDGQESPKKPQPETAISETKELPEKPPTETPEQTKEPATEASDKKESAPSHPSSDEKVPQPTQKLGEVGESDISYTSDYSDTESTASPIKVPPKSPTKDQEVQKMDYSSSTDTSSYYSDDESTAAPSPTIPRFRQNQQTQEIDLMPPALKEIVFHAKDSLVYQALQGVPLQGLNQAMILSVVNDLRKYIDLAVDNGLIDEALYVQKCIDATRENKSGEKLEADREIRDLDRKLQEAYAELDERMLFWDNEQTTRERELEMALEELNMSHEAALNELDREWQSAKKQQFYNKPSPALLNLRDVAKKLIKTKKLEEVKKVAALIEAKEREETSEAARRMNADYHQADAKLKEQYEADKATLISTYEKKIYNVSRCREQNLRPIHQRIQNLEKLKREAATTVKKCTEKMAAAAAAAAAASPRRPGTAVTTSRNTSRPRERQQAQNQLPSLIAKPKLLLPPVQRIKREGGTRSQSRQQTPTGTKTICRPQTLQRLSSAHSGRSTSRQNQNM